MSIDVLNHNKDSNGRFWWHSIKLNNGTVTPGAKPLDVLEQEMQQVFAATGTIGKSILDVGAFNGGWTIEALRRGAHRVVALDYPVWNDPEFRGRASIEYALANCGLRAELVDCDLDKPRLDLSFLGSFDIILVLGVFYNLVNPLAAFRELCCLANEHIVIETYMLEDKETTAPLMMFSPNNDYGVYWRLNEVIIIKMLDHWGFDASIINRNTKFNRVTVLGTRRN